MSEIPSRLRAYDPAWTGEGSCFGSPVERFMGYFAKWFTAPRLDIHSEIRGALWTMLIEAREYGEAKEQENKWVTMERLKAERDALREQLRDANARIKKMEISEAGRSLSRLANGSGGAARAKALTRERRIEIARQAAATRWNNPTLAEEARQLNEVLEKRLEESA